MHRQSEHHSGNMPALELPGEITDRIISHVWPDTPTLLSCALVCSRWLPASRHHLFAVINSLSKPSYDLLVARVLHSDSMRPWLASVRSMEFWEYRRIGDGRWQPLPPEEQIGQFFFRDFIGHLPNMGYLRFQGEDWAHCPPHPSAFVGFSQFPSLWKLELFGCWFPSFAALRQMLSSLPALSSLMINEAQWPASPHPHPVSAVGPGSRPKLETLYFVMEGVNQCAREFMDWLVQTASRSSIRHLEVFRGDDPATDPWSVISTHTHLFAASVDFLRIIYVEHSLSSLSDFTNLRDLSIDVLDTMHGYPDWEGIARLLQGLRCSLHTLGIAFTYASQPPHYPRTHTPRRDVRSSVYEDGMEALDPVLEHKRFQELKRVFFSAQIVLAEEDYSLASRPAHTQEGLNEIIKRKLAKLAKRVDARAVVHVRMIPRKET